MTIARRGVQVAGAFAILKLLLHLATNWRYGFFRDEFLYLAYGRHLDWGYPDAAPLLGLTAWFVSHVLGDSLQALRLLPALAGAGTVFLTGLLCLEMGGGAVAVAVACLCAVAAPVNLAINTLFSMNSFEPLVWMGALYLVLLALRRDRPQLLPWAGVCLGLGLENKHSAAFFALSLAAGLALSPQRAILKNRWLWCGVGVAFLLFLPNLIWQYRHDWATYTLLENVRRTHKNVELAPPAFLGQQIFMLLPATVLVWGAGLVKALRERALRFAGLTFVVFLALMMALKAKDYYLAPIYPMLFAAGGVWWSARKAWARTTVVAAIVVMGVVAAPMVLPLLPVERFIAYQHGLGIRLPKTEHGHAGPLPQIFGDMFGWPEMVAKIAQAWNALPPEERARTHIFCNNYGEAGAVDFFGPRYGLPRVICAHQGFYYFSPRGARKGDNLIVTQDTPESLRRWCDGVEDLGAVGHPYAMAEEHFSLLYCRGLKVSLEEVWPRLRHWN
ncbi:MAG: glycosyltransferase family 39 protein [Acidobacteria bacterium]|nr:glycosyltransferase family 39 protein [Acidobacteriota bacterium]